jgi:hypothetical protein
MDVHGVPTREGSKIIEGCCGHLVFLFLVARGLHGTDFIVSAAQPGMAAARQAVFPSDPGSVVTSISSETPWPPSPTSGGDPLKKSGSLGGSPQAHPLWPLTKV